MTGRTAAGIEDWGAILAESLVAFEVEAPRPGAFRGRLRHRRVADLELVEMATDGHVSRREAALARAGRPEYVVCLQVAGVGEVHQDRRTAVLQPGDLTLFDATRPATVVSSAGFRNVCVKLPQRLLPVPARQLTATRIKAGEGLLPATATLLTTLAQVLDDLPAAARHLAARSVVDLLTTTFHGVGSERRPAGFAALCEYIDEHLADPDLGPGRVAAAGHVSLRQVHAVFGEHGTTVAGWIRARRLQRCREDLTGLPGVPAGVIGQQWGFKTASHFGRVFKAAHGLTPAEFRRRG